LTFLPSFCTLLRCQTRLLAPVFSFLNEISPIDVLLPFPHLFAGRFFQMAWFFVSIFPFQPLFCPWPCYPTAVGIFVLSSPLFFCDTSLFSVPFYLPSLTLASAEGEFSFFMVFRLAGFTFFLRKRAVDNRSSLSGFFSQFLMVFPPWHLLPLSRPAASLAVLIVAIPPFNP